MPLSFSTATGNLFVRWGKIGALIANMRGHQNTQYTALTDTVLGLVAQYNLESDVQAIVGSSYIGLLNSIGSIGSFCQQMASATLQRQVFRDNPQLNQTLDQNTDNLTCLLEVIRQMKVAGASILAQTIAATPLVVSVPGPHFTGNSNGIINTSTKRPTDALILQNAFAENLTLTCINDSFLGGATLGNEALSLTGTGQEGNPFAFNWPLGSNAQTSLEAIDGDADATSGNLLTNSGWENWTNDVPDNWTIEVGLPGTHVFDENTIVYDPQNEGSSMRLTGDGSTLVELTQQFDSSDGTIGELEPLSQYSFNGFFRRDGVAAAAGVMTIDLIDGDGAVVQDAAGSNNSFTIDLTALNTVFTSYAGTFRTPLEMPEEIYLRFRFTTALTAGRSVYLDKLSLGLMTQSIASGIWLAVHSGSTPFIQGDWGTVQVSNGRGAAGTLNTFATLLSRLFPDVILGNELIFPYSTTPTIQDTQIS